MVLKLLNNRFEILNAFIRLMKVIKNFISLYLAFYFVFNVLFICKFSVLRVINMFLTSVKNFHSHLFIYEYFFFHNECILKYSIHMR